MISARFVDVDLERPRYRMTATYRFTPRLQAGLEWNPKAGEVGFIGNYILATETESRPMINFGTSSDRIGTPPGPHAYYVTFAKGIPPLKASAYVSLNYSEHDQRFNLPFGFTLGLAQRWDAMYMMDGVKSHLLLTYKADSFNVTAMWIWLKHPGISVSWGF